MATGWNDAGHLRSIGGLTRRGLGRIALGAGSAAALPAGSVCAADPVPRRGGTLVMVLDGDPPTLNPDITTGVPDVIVGDLMLEGLTRIDDTLQAAPNLASAWTISADHTRYTFKLVEANWHDGKPFTSADVKFTLERVSRKYGAKFNAAASHIQAIDTPDERTVVLTLDKPFGPLLFSLSNYTNAAILPAHVYGDADVLAHPATLAHPIGTGPFMFKEWVRGDHITLARNPGYWRKDLPYLDQVVLKIIPDPASRVLALKTGEIDYCYFYYFPTARFAEIEHDPNLQWRERAPRGPSDHHQHACRAVQRQARAPGAAVRHRPRVHPQGGLSGAGQGDGQRHQLQPWLGGQSRGQSREDVSLRPRARRVAAGRRGVEAQGGRDALRSAPGV